MLDPTGRFTGRVDDYEQYRPDYPHFVVDILRRDCGLAPTHAFADVGCGTGKLARLWIENGNYVYGVEPNEDMWRAAHRLLGGYPNFVAVRAAAEDTSLPAACVDFVSVGQAFHWFDRVAAAQEFLRIMRPDAWLVVVRNTRRRSGSQIALDWEALLQRHCPEYGGVTRRFKGSEAYLRDAGFAFESVEHSQSLDLPGLKGRLQSQSVVPRPGEAGHEPMTRDIEALFATHAIEGRVTLPQDTQIFYGRRSLISIK